MKMTTMPKYSDKWVLMQWSDDYCDWEHTLLPNENTEGGKEVTVRLTIDWQNCESYLTIGATTLKNGMDQPDPNPLCIPLTFESALKVLSE